MARTPPGCSACEALPRLLLLCVVLAANALPGGAEAQAGEPKLGLVNLADKGVTRNDCWLYLPESYDKTKRYRLVVCLHPAGLRGSHSARQWAALTVRRGRFVVLAPECADTKRRLWKLADERGVVAAALYVVNNYSIDPRHVLLTGFSQGAVYTYNFGLRNPTVFRAIAPISGALFARPSPMADRILHNARAVPVHIVHGARDRAMPVERARAARDRLEALGYRVTYREYPYLGHQFPPMAADRILTWFIALAGQPTPREKPTPRKK